MRLNLLLDIDLIFYYILFNFDLFPIKYERAKLAAAADSIVQQASDTLHHLGEQVQVEAGVP